MNEIKSLQKKAMKAALKVAKGNKFSLNDVAKELNWSLEKALVVALPLASPEVNCIVPQSVFGTTSDDFPQADHVYLIMPAGRLLVEQMKADWWPSKWQIIWPLIAAILVTLASEAIKAGFRPANQPNAATTPKASQ